MAPAKSTRRPTPSPPHAQAPLCARCDFSYALLEQAYAWVCKQRQRYPANADIWDLRFHWQTVRTTLMAQLVQGTYRFKPLLLVQRADGTRCALWSSSDALVIKCMALLLETVLPTSPLCEHLRVHGGGKASVAKTHRRLTSGKYPFICRTDIRGYYAHIDKALLYRQLQPHVRSRVMLGLLHQFLHYSVEDGGEFHTPTQGIARGSALSPLLAAFHLLALDNEFAARRSVRYALYMDDFLIFAPTRWQLRHAVRRLNQTFEKMGVVQHPDKTFIGRVEKGFDWMGVWFTEKGATAVAPRALNNFSTQLRRLYEHVRGAHPELRRARMAGYVKRWSTWCTAILCRSAWNPEDAKPESH